MPDDNAPIGITLSKNKDELLVEYATYECLLLGTL